MHNSATSTGHVVLLGDSIFDNAAYVRPKPAVIDQVRRELPNGWRATLLAVDGSIASDVPEQLDRLPAEATHLILSAGGNDALSARGVFSLPVSTAGEALYELAQIRRRFDADYQRALRAVLSRGLPTVVCTIYDPNFSAPSEQQTAVAGLAIFNDGISRAALRAGLPLIDLRLLFTGPGDYANSIEPSETGGGKIAREIRRIATEHDFAQRRSVVYAGR